MVVVPPLPTQSTQPVSSISCVPQPKSGCSSAADLSLLTDFSPVSYLCEEVCKLSMDLGSEGGARHIDESLSVHLLCNLHLLQNLQGLFLRRLKALCNYSGMEALGGQNNKDELDSKSL